MRVIAHADMDAFYASVEQLDDPRLRGLPVIVGGLGRRGVVSAASYEARRFGVRSAMPMFEARRRCPGGVFRPGRMRRYEEVSSQIFAIFGDFTPRVEALSLDEAFLDLSGTQRLHGPPREAATRLRARVRSECGLAISVGIGPSKLVAKIASDQAKPDGLLEVDEDAVAEFLAPLSVARIPGVGPKSLQRLEALGLLRFGDLQRAGEARLQSALGDWGIELHALARGEDPRAVEDVGTAHSFGEEHTFETDASDPALLARTLGEHAEALARRLRRSGLRARRVTLRIKRGGRLPPGAQRHPIHSRQVTLADATDHGAEIAREARALLQRLAPGESLRLIGISVSLFDATGAEQADLFGESASRAERRQLDRALDALRERFGETAVVRGGSLPAPAVGAGSSRRSAAGRILEGGDDEG